MASIGDMDLQVGDVSIACGAAFQLSSPAIVDWAHTDAGGSSVVFQRGKKYVIVLLPHLELGDALIATAYRHVQRALDILSIQADGDLTLPGGPDGEVSWWRIDGKVRLKLKVSVSRVFSMAPVIAVVRDMDGTIIPGPPPPPPPLWHPTFRYFRLSQATDDLYEAYRNMFLAFESVASSMFPLLGPEKEAVWLDRVTCSLGGLLADFVDPGVSDVVGAFRKEQYKGIRCALFHAKQNRDAILPGEISNREQVARAYERLARLVIRLCQQHLHIQRHGGVVTLAGVNLMMSGLSQMLVIAVSEQSNILETRVDQMRNGTLSNLVTRFAGPADDSGFAFAFSGEGAVTDLVSPHVRSVVTHGGDTQPMLITKGDIDALDLDGVDLFEVSHVFAMSNRSSPRERFVL